MKALTLVLMLVSASAAPAQTAATPPSAPQPVVAPVLRAPPWEIPGLISWVDSSGVQMSDGVPVELSMGRSKRSVEELLQHFATAFEKAGLYIPPGSEQVRVFKEPQLTALDPKRLVAYTVIFQPNPDKTTTVILGTSDLTHYTPPAARARQGSAPRVTGTEQPRPSP